MKKAFFPGLAITNLRKNAKFYVPYILTVVGTVASFYILTALASDKAMEQLRGADYIGIVSGLGMFVAGIFSVIFLMYTNSFLMKRRHREFGLYNILGMGKGHIACILCLESLYVALIGIVFGLFAGILLHKLVTLILHKILHFDVPFGFRISFTAITVCAVFFSAIILLTLLINLHKIRISKPIELLRSSSEGEREPKTKLFLAISNHRHSHTHCRVLHSGNGKGSDQRTSFLFRSCFSRDYRYVLPIYLGKYSLT